jgi:hypothetical protein
MNVVNFPAEEPVAQKGVSVSFPALVGGQRINCAVSSEALCDQLGAEYHDIKSAFLRHRHRINMIVTKLIHDGRFEADGTILVRKEDI